MLDLNDYYYFVQVVEKKGFSAAGRALDLPKSTLSRRIIELEKRLGVRLIERTSRSFVMTDAGAEFHRHALAMLIEADAAENAVKRRLAEPSGTAALHVLGGYGLSARGLDLPLPGTAPQGQRRSARHQSLRRSGRRRLRRGAARALRAAA